MLTVKNIRKTYGNLVVVDNLSFEVGDGEIFGLLGENGAGKTTTFRMIIGLLEKDKGEVLLDGEEVNYQVTDKIGFVTEERSLLTKLTVKEQALYYGALKSMEHDQILKELDKWLDRFQISQYKNKKIKELSKGNQQKVQFICAILNHPKLLILDEPFTGLDPINVKILKEVIYELKSENTSIIFSSHQMEYIEELCEKLVILVKGKTILEGYLPQIKDDYGIKKVVIKGKNIPLSKLEKIKGVGTILEKDNEFIIDVLNGEVANKIFQVVKSSEILKFEAVTPSLSDIFIEKVGGYHE